MLFSTLRNGCQAHVKFGISLDKQYLEVKSCSDVHNHEISKVRFATHFVFDIYYIHLSNCFTICC